MNFEKAVLPEIKIIIDAAILKITRNEIIMRSGLFKVVYSVITDENEERSSEAILKLHSPSLRTSQ